MFNFKKQIKDLKSELNDFYDMTIDEEEKIRKEIDLLRDRCEKIEYIERERYNRILDYLGVEEEEYAELEEESIYPLIGWSEPERKAVKKTRLIKNKK